MWYGQVLTGGAILKQCLIAHNEDKISRPYKYWVNSGVVG